VTHIQCDARPTVTFPAAGHHRPLTGNKLYCLVHGRAEAHACEQLAHDCYLKAGLEPATLEPVVVSPTRYHRAVSSPGHRVVSQRGCGCQALLYSECVRCWHMRHIPCGRTPSTQTPRFRSNEKQLSTSAADDCCVQNIEHSAHTIRYDARCQWRQREFKVGGDEPCEPTVRLPD